MIRSAILTLVFSFALASFGYSQFGISARIQNNNNKTWNDTYQTAADTSQNLLNRSYEFGVNYWFKLKEYRVEFLPEISIAFAEDKQLYSGLLMESHKRTSYNFNFNVQVYPLDFIGDCDCPTFSKDGNLVSKGFYWLLSPGLSYHTLSTEPKAISSFIPDDETMTTFRMGVGAGLDIGFTDLFTLSPFIMYSMNFGNAWPGQYDAYFLERPEGENNSANINQWQLGLRLIFRPDYK